MIADSRRRGGLGRQRSGRRVGADFSGPVPHARNSTHGCVRGRLFMEDRSPEESF